MKKKRSRSRSGSSRRSGKPPPGGAPGRQPGRRLAPRELQYKVVELSTVDEGSLERALNEWTAKGWNLDGIQFAMRESSKRPAMAFVFFTRPGEPAVARVPEEAAGARDRLRQLAGLPEDDLAAAAFAPPPESGVGAAVELAAAALFDVTPAEPENAGAGDQPSDGDNGAVRWVELPEESDE